MKIWAEFNELFTWMPLAALVKCAGEDGTGNGGKIFCCHGGIPAKKMTPDFGELRQLHLPFKSPKDNYIVADLLWSDPNEDVDEFQENPRGLGHQFGPSQVAEFCVHHDVDLIVRAHQVFKEGYKRMGNNCVTIFSAPN